MAAYNKFQNFVERLGLGQFNLNTDTLKVYLTNATPDAAADDVKADLAEISAGNGYTAGGEDTLNTFSEAAGTASCVGTDVTWTASGGSIGPFRYVVLYDDTHGSDALIGWWDAGTNITLAAGEAFTTDFGASMFTLA